MIALNFPAFVPRVKHAEGKVWIFDGIRKKYLVLTPEEWVRQHLVNYLVEHMGYPRTLLRVEQGLSYNGLLKRADVVVYTRNGLPWLVAECKAPQYKVNAEALHQVSVYNTSLQGEYALVTNGLQHVLFRIDHAHRQVHRVENFPHYPQ